MRAEIQALNALAGATTAMTNIAIQESTDGKNIDWLEKVSDEHNSTVHTHAA